MTKKSASKTSPARPSAKPAARASRSDKPLPSTEATAETTIESASHDAGEMAPTSSTRDSERAVKKPSARASASSPGDVASPEETEETADACEQVEDPTEAQDPAIEAAARETATHLVEHSDAAAVTYHADRLGDEDAAVDAMSSRVLDHLVTEKPELLIPVIDRLAHAVVSSASRRAVRTAANALPSMARVAPAKVARQLPILTDGFESASEPGKHGLVCTFAALCTASVAYQKRLEPVLDTALSTAPPEKLLGWAEIILPALKGEPHARARDVVQERLPTMARSTAQPIAAFLGVRLRPTQR